MHDPSCSKHPASPHGGSDLLFFVFVFLFFFLLFVLCRVWALSSVCGESLLKTSLDLSFRERSCASELNQLRPRSFVRGR